MFALPGRDCNDVPGSLPYMDTPLPRGVEGKLPDCSSRSLVIHWTKTGQAQSAKQRRITGEAFGR